MTLEKNYYENADRWEPRDRDPGELERIDLTIREIPTTTRSLLDVGCGDGIFVNALIDAKREFDRLHAFDRSAAAIRFARCDTTLGDIQSMPFEDAEFDLVTALQVIEHLPVPIYAKGLGELCRVAKEYVLVTVPYRQDLEQMLIACPACTARFNPYYHLRSFDDEAMRTLLDPYGFTCIRSRYLGKTAVPVGVPAILRRLPRKPSSENPYEWPLPCAVCGYELPARPRQSGNSQRPGRWTLRSALKSFWPNAEVPVRILGLYRRAD